MKPKKAAKKPRTRIDSRIAAAKTPDERRNLAMYGQSTPPSRIQFLVGEWALVNFLRDNPKAREVADAMTLETWKANEMTGDFDKQPGVDRLLRAQKNGMEFIRDAMLQWDADAMIALGKEMKRQAAAPSGFNLDQYRRALLACGVGPYKAARAITERLQVKGQDKIKNEERQLKRIKARWRKGDT